MIDLRMLVAGGLILSTALCFSPRDVLASDGGATARELPAPLVSADQAYKRGGAGAFLDALLGGSVGGGSEREQALAVVSFLRQVEGSFGPYIGVEMIGELPVSDSTRAIYYTLKFERGPVFGFLSVYTIEDEDLVTGYAVNTELHRIVPPVLLIGNFNVVRGDN